MNFKHDFDKQRFNDLPEPLKFICHEMAYYFQFHNQEFVITATWTTAEEDKLAGRKHKTHQQKRAVDIRLKHLDKDFIDDFIRRFNSLYLSWGAWVKDKQTGKMKNVLLYDHGTGDNYHLHLQIRSDYTKIKIPGELHGKVN
jgi:hypothetical protein